MGNEGPELRPWERVPYEKLIVREVEAAEYVGLNVEQFRQQVKAGAIPRYKLDVEDYVYYGVDLEKWLEGPEAAKTRQQVYFAQAEHGGPIKIGIAVDVDRRIAALTAASPYPLRAIFVLPGGIEAERLLHRELKAHRLHGEWFANSAVMLDRLDRLMCEAGVTPGERAEILDRARGVSR